LVKFKTIYVVFNVVIISSFAFMFFLPLVMLGPEYFDLFVARNWIAGLLFLAALVVINLYFLRNWKLFRLLEQQDWPAVTRLLHERVYERRSLSSKNVKMLLNAYLISSRLDDMLALSAFVEENRPRLMARFALPFGIPHLLRNEPEQAERFFGKYLESPGAKQPDWLAWNHAFALLQQKKVEPARSELLAVLGRNPEPVLRLLSLYMLHSVTGEGEETAERIEVERNALAGRFTTERWRKEVEAASKNVEVVLLSAILREAETWLFADRQGAAFRE
jgi:hypothetical protein